MSVNYDQGDSPNSGCPVGSASNCRDYSRPPPRDLGGTQPPTGWRSKATSKYQRSITLGNGGQDRQIKSRINAASQVQVFKIFKKSEWA